MDQDQRLIEQGCELEKQGEYGKAIQKFHQAVELDPRDANRWSMFAGAFRRVQFVEFDGRLKHALVRCLHQPINNHQDLAFAAISLLKLTPEFQQFAASTKRGEWNLQLKIFNDPLVLGLLEKVVMPDPSIEQLMTYTRRKFLLLHRDGGLAFHAVKIKPFLYGLAHHNFLNEYVYAISEEEQRILNEMTFRIPWDAPEIDEGMVCSLLLLGCYRPLRHIENLKHIKHYHEEAFNRFLRLQVFEPLEEMRLSNEVRTLGSIQDPVSLKVQAQYEDNPYPRWTSVHEAFHSEKIAKLKLKPQPAILIAGCGTGQHAFNTALEFPESRILAIDLSRKSLAYAIRKARELQVNTIEFVQADILELNNLKEKFDIIECTGVLHHMKDPLEGWRVLKGLLKPGGMIQIGLYSSLSRQDIALARAFIKNKGYETNVEGIRRCRQEIIGLPDEDPIKKVMRSIDFYTTSSCRDLLFHVQEHTFNLGQIRAMLNTLQLQFMGFDIKDPAIKNQYSVQYPDDPEGLSLEHWEEFEQQNPLTFYGMYQFWVCGRGIIEAEHRRLFK